MISQVHYISTLQISLVLKYNHWLLQVMTPTEKILVYNKIFVAEVMELFLDPPAVSFGGTSSPPSVSKNAVKVLPYTFSMSLL